MTIISAVYHSLKRKKSADAEAIRLGIPTAHYLKIKDKVMEVVTRVGDKIDDTVIALVEKELSKKGSHKTDDEILAALETAETSEDTGKRVSIHEDLESGTSKITGIATTEPRTAEEIIRILGIDTSKWKLSQYWNKEKSDRWEISALVSKKPEAEQIQHTFLELLENYDLPSLPAPESYFLNATATEKVCGVFSLQDLHFGKTGNEDMGAIMNDAVKYLVDKAHKNYFLEKIVLVIGPDTLNMDTFGGTTTKGTPVENSESATDTYLKAFDAICQAVTTLSHFSQNVEVVFIPGNHDRLSSFHLLHAVKQVFREWSTVQFNIEYAERKVLKYGENMLCFEHGDVSAKNNPLVFAVEFAEQWGTCAHRMLYTGHYHGRKTKEFVTENEEHGFVTRIIPALTSSDYYHYHNKYVGNKRSAIMHLHDVNKGLITEFVYSV
jgi:hypothetical protein